MSNFHFYFLVGIRALIIQNKIEKIESLIGTRELIGNTTVSISDDDYMKQLNFGFKIETEEDIQKYSVFIDGFFKDFAFPFFEKFSTVDAIDKHLNNDPEDTMPKYCNNLAKKITAPPSFVSSQTISRESV